jgi:cytochrome P450
VEFAQRVVDAHRKNPNKSKQDTLIRLIEGTAVLANNDEEKVSNAWLCLFAGMDTTGFTLSNAMVFLAKHQPVQEKLRRELANAGDTRPEDVPCFGRVVKESNQSLPAGSMNPWRQAGRAFELNGMVAPKGALVGMPQMLHNHDGRHFEDPDNCRPEHW